MNPMARCFYGFADGKTEMQKSNIYSRLSSAKRKGTTYHGVNYNGVRYSYMEYIRQLVKESEDLLVVERDGKKEYRVVFPDHMMVVLNKTQFDFACYLKENGFADDAKAEAFYEKEQQAMREQYDREKAEEQAAAEKRIAYNVEKHAFNDSLNQWMLEMEQLHPNAVLVAKKMAADHGYSYGLQLLRILALMHHAEMLEGSSAACELYKKSMRESLYTGNKVSRKLFQLYSGMKLPATVSGTNEALEKWFQSPIVMTDEELAGKPKEKRTRRSSETIAILRILEENEGNVNLYPALYKGRYNEQLRDQEYMLFNGNRIYILYHPDPSIPVVKESAASEKMVQFGYHKVDEYTNLYDPIDRDWTLKTIREYMEKYPGRGFQIDNRHTETYLRINPMYLQEALVILGEDAVFYHQKYMTIAKSERGLALMCMLREVR